MNIVKQAALTAIPALMLAVGGCEMDVEDKGKMPSVDVDATSGQLPEYKIEKTQEGKMPSVDVDAEPGRIPDVDVRGPDVDVDTKPVVIPVPDVDVTLPSEQDSTSKTDND